MVVNLGMTFGDRFLAHAGALTLGICATVVISALIYGTFIWARWIPAAVSLSLAIITWVVAVWMALRKTHIL